MKTLGIRTSRLRLRMGAGRITVGLWVLGILLLELLGRGIRTDGGDIFGLLLLAGGVIATGVVHHRTPLPWITRTGGLVKRATGSLRACMPKLGVDFRGQPRYVAGTPPIAWWVVSALGLVTAGLLLLGAFLPSGMRTAITGVSYTLWLVWLGTLWTGLVVGIFATVVFTVMMIHDAWLLPVENELERRRARRRVHRSLIAAGVLLVTAGIFLPGWIALAAIGVMIIVAAAALLTPGGARLDVAWRASDGQIRRIGARRALAIQAFALGLAMVDVCLLACGEQFAAALGFGLPVGPEVGSAAGLDVGLDVGLATALDHGPLRTTPITTALGLVFVWTTTAAFCGATLHVLHVVACARMTTGPLARPAVFVHDAPDGPDRVRILSVLADHGYAWRAPPHAPRPGDVQIRIVDDPPPHVDHAGPTWPLPVTVEQLGSGVTLDRIARRFEILQRRVVNRGLRRLFKHAARWTHDRGQGYWIGLQHWFVLGLSRDEEDENPGWTQRPILQQTIGPPYHRIFTRAARAHFARVMSALEVDMIFIEDRVGFRRFRRVLGVLYEIYDIHGGRQRIEEMHFSGLRRCRVIVCEVTPDEPFRSDAYPEPDYDDIGRARVLHVFRDREDNAVDTPSPRSSTGRPVPVPAGV